MEKIDFLAGTEQRFLDFVSNIGENDRVAVISHTDLDGISAGKIVSGCVKADLVRFIDYLQIDEQLVEELSEANITKVIITDMATSEYEHIIEKIAIFSDVLMIDHHIFGKDMNSDKITFINSKNYCATYLAYYLFSKIKNLESLDWLVACACISDWMYFKNQKWMNDVFRKYGDKFEILEDDQIRKSGKFWDLQWTLSLAIIYWKSNKKLIEVFYKIGEDFGEIGDLASVAGEVEDEINKTIEEFDKGKKEINGRIVFEFKPNFNIISIVSTVLSSKIWDKTFLICRESKDYYHFSARRQDGKEEVNVLLKKLTEGFERAEGGGHQKAAGGHVLLKDKEKFLEKLSRI